MRVGFNLKVLYGSMDNIIIIANGVCARARVCLFNVFACRYVHVKNTNYINFDLNTGCRIRTCTWRKCSNVYTVKLQLQIINCYTNVHEVFVFSYFEYFKRKTTRGKNHDNNKNKNSIIPIYTYHSFYTLDVIFPLRIHFKNIASSNPLPPLECSKQSKQPDNCLDSTDSTTTTCRNKLDRIIKSSCIRVNILHNPINGLCFLVRSY